MDSETVNCLLQNALLLSTVLFDPTLVSVSGHGTTNEMVTEFFEVHEKNILEKITWKSSTAMALIETKLVNRKVRQSLYGGKVFVLRQLPSLLKLCELSRTHYLDNSITEEEIEATLRKYEKSKETRYLFASALTEAGVVLKTTNWDRLRLRIQKPGTDVDVVSDNKYGTGRFSSTLPLHRDTWASNIQCQINWWAPLSTITEKRTLQLFPSFFKKPVSNNSASWNLETLKKRRNESKSYPQMPICTASGEELSSIMCDSIPIVIEPGDMLVFSSAHLHSSVPNTSSLPRFSTEIRTYHKGDFEHRIGAPNVDGQCSDSPHLSWFTEIAGDS